MKLSRRVFSFPVAICSLLGVLAVCTVRGHFDDPDLWLHLKTGQIVWTTHSVPSVDAFSYTTGHLRTVPHEWLGQTSIYAAYHFGGYSGLMLWLCLFASAILIAGYALCSVYSGNAKVSLAGALLIWLFAMRGFSIRPQMIGYLLLIVELLIVYFGRTRDRRWFFLLPPLFALWVNLHGSFSLGLTICGIVLLAAFFNFQIGLLQAPRWDRPTRRAFAVALVLCVPALFVNPAGPRLVLYPFQALGSMTVAVSAVSEWQPLALDDPRGLCLLAALAAIVLVVVVRRSTIFLHEVLFIAAATYLATSHRRLSFAFGILVAPVLCRLLADTWENYSAEDDRPIPNGILIALALVVSWLAFPSQANLVAQVAKGSPVGAVNFIEQNHLTGPMLNDWVSGSYLIWAAPDHPVFIDGRGDPYDETGVTQQFGDWAMLQTDPRILLDKYRISFCLLSRGSPMTFVLPLMPEWKLAYSDNVAAVYVREPR
jgi:hypothetical protein